MSFYLEVIRIYVNINIDFDLIDATKDECDGLDLNTTNSFKVFRSGEKCAKIIDFLKKHVS